MTTKTFPKYWAVDIEENAKHKLLPKFKEWYCKASGYIWHYTAILYGYTGDNTSTN
jgi:hypothetical protein